MISKYCWIKCIIYDVFLFQEEDGWDLEFREYGIFKRLCSLFYFKIKPDFSISVIFLVRSNEFQL